MGSWKMKDKPELVRIDLDNEAFRAVLADIAKILYKHFCQFDSAAGASRALPFGTHTPDSASRDLNLGNDKEVA